jgi:hypothetical protein
MLSQVVLWNHGCLPDARRRDCSGISAADGPGASANYLSDAMSFAPHPVTSS